MTIQPPTPRHATVPCPELGVAPPEPPRSAPAVPQRSLPMPIGIPAPRAAPPSPVLAPLAPPSRSPATQVAPSLTKGPAAPIPAGQASIHSTRAQVVNQEALAHLPPAPTPSATATATAGSPIPASAPVPDAVAKLTAKIPAAQKPARTRRGRPRRTPNERASARMEFRVCPSINAQFEARCIAKGTTGRDHLRHVMEHGEEPQVIERIVRVISTYDEQVARLIGDAGRNLNQIARALNAMELRGFLTPEDLRQLRQPIDDAVVILRRITIPSRTSDRDLAPHFGGGDATTKKS